MNEIEKMYENAEVEKTICKYAEYGYEGEEGTWYYCTKENKECWTYPTGNADCVEKAYPPFTAEKQLELIKWLATRELKIKTQKQPCVTYIGILDQYECFYGIEETHFEQALAGVINYLWQDLTSEEKEQIRGILK